MSRWEYIYEVVYCLLLLISSISCNSYHSCGFCVCGSYLQNFNLFNYAWWTILEFQSTNNFVPFHLYFKMTIHYTNEYKFYILWHSISPFKSTFSPLLKSVSVWLGLGICGRYLFWRVQWNTLFIFTNYLQGNHYIINNSFL